MLWREHKNDILVSFSSNNVSRKRKAEPFSHCSYFRGHSRNQPKGMGRRNSLNVTPWQVSQTYMYFTELTHTQRVQKPLQIQATITAVFCTYRTKRCDVLVWSRKMTNVLSTNYFCSVQKVAPVFILF